MGLVEVRTSQKQPAVERQCIQKTIALLNLPLENVHARILTGAVDTAQVVRFLPSK